MRATITDLKELLDDSYNHKAVESLKYANELSQKNNLGSVTFSDARSPVDFEQLSLLNAKKAYTNCKKTIHYYIEAYGYTIQEKRQHLYIKRNLLT